MEEALAEPPENPLAVDGTVQRFEFAIEILWKTLKRKLATEGIEAGTPRDTIKHAYHVGWLENETVWLQMLADRNAASHIYDDESAQRIYDRIRGNFGELRRAYEMLRRRE